MRGYHLMAGLHEDERERESEGRGLETSEVGILREMLAGLASFAILSRQPPICIQFAILTCSFPVYPSSDKLL